jgi:transitional endoplasmic reticulum ATPase
MPYKRGYMRKGAYSNDQSAIYRRAIGYAANIVRRLARTSREGAALWHWAVHHKAALGLSLAGKHDDNDFAWGSDRGPTTVRDWRALEAALEAASASPSTRNAYDPVAHLATEVGCDDMDGAILRLFLDYRSAPIIERLWDAISESRYRYEVLKADPSLIAELIDQEAREVAKRLAPSAHLRSSGLIAIDPDLNVVIHPRVRRLAAETMERIPDIRMAVLGQARPASLNFADFGHLGRDAELTLALLAGALSGREAGIHVLLYGPPGTGKTEFAKALAASLAVPLIAVAEEDDLGCEPTRGERLLDLQLAQRLLAGGDPALILVDEAEDIFPSHGSGPGRDDLLGAHDIVAPGIAGGSKVFLHRMLEQGRAPVIWTANSLASFGPAVLRRMACCVELAIPPTPVRAALWARAAQQEGIEIPSDELNRLARSLPAAPALARSAMRAARLAGGNAETAGWAVRGVARAMHNGRLPKGENEPADFDPALVSADIDLVSLADRLSSTDAPRAFSLLASGPPGSGKSAFVRHLAGRMGLEAVQKRASDLFSAYVGETEKRIAEAFREAADTGTFLIFDEADSLLAPRNSAVRNWEVSFVNEMLTWMERHPLPFCCTTNLLDRIDEAAMRRFLIKAQFGYLRPAQLELAWSRTFEVPPPAGLRRLDRLTPADFAVVRRGAALLGDLRNETALTQALEREQKAKAGAANPIGFLQR